MVFLRVPLVSVSLGLIPFSGSYQLGLLIVIMAVLMFASGDILTGSLPRLWLAIAVGFLFAVLGIVFCIIFEILVRR